ncbi:TRAP transporter small permease [Acuticoccus sediminis]|uniref:TRAP transporter small permease n=1 Tax=Acuticoccus sediminis TaxID=2184697 RepID=UPI001CFEE6D1|nr:TRAP transporter small permease [Acuticoccus sediminis]
MADWTAAGMAAVLTVVFAVMIALVFLQVVDRFVPWFSYFWTEEVVRILLVWSVMMGLPVVLYIHGEIIVDILPLPPKATIWRLRLATLLGAIFLGFLAWYGYAYAARSVNFMLPTLGISRAWVYAPIPLGAALGIIALLFRRESGADAYPTEMGDDNPVLPT